ncbi:hypothetical protein Y032_0230g2940 [Ancylostoma ceylanicum]|uniref:Phosphatidylinositol-specific phospholipase C X domain-containing protein n=2 Tax=Ancylostoma ceylanicum TaxID=53326 RepID=A0A016SGT2_9BILA|nr:hypothetical protein Y032_0230g2940 [Ancylostoma ceylanicum]
MTSSLANWMASLPPELTSRPICSLKIPGSHDSGATQSLNQKLPVANDESASIRRLGKAPCVRRGIKRWAVTQSYSIREQLDLGVRYLDLRVSYPPAKVRESSSDFRLIHALYGPKLQDVLQEVVDFLQTNTKEVILLDMNHLYDFDVDTYALLKSQIIKVLGNARICPVNLPNKTSLDYMWTNGYRVIIFSPVNEEASLFWPSTLIPSPWPNTNKVNSLLQILESELDTRCKSCDPVAFFVSQGVLTPKASDVVRKWFSSLRSALSQTATKRVLQWLATVAEKKKEKINVVILDFVDEQSSSEIISLNGPNPKSISIR